MIKSISQKEFDKVKSSNIAVVEFNSTWCGSCQKLAPIVEEISEELSDRLDFYNIDVDDNPDITESFGIDTIPTLVVLKNGERVDQKVGYYPKEKVLEFLESNI